MKKEYEVKYMEQLETTMVFRYDTYSSGAINLYIVDYYAGMPNEEDSQRIINNDCGGDYVCGFDYDGWAK